MNSNQIRNVINSAAAAADQAQNTPDKEARREAFLKKKEQLNALYAASLEKMRNGDSKLFQDFLDTAAKFMSAEMFKNLVLLAAQRPDATLVKPGYVWAKKGMKLPQKEKAIDLLVKGAMWTDQKKGTTGFYYDPKECYDVSDLEGVRLTSAEDRQEDHGRVIAAICTVLEDPQKHEAVKDTQKRDPVALVISEDQISDACYDPATSTISVRKDLPPKDCCESVIMEMCHRERYLGGWETDQRTHEDMFIAYSATYVICRRLSLPAEDFDFPAEFLAAKDTEAFEKELRSIVKTAEVISGRLDAELIAMERAAEKELAETGPAVTAPAPVQGV